MFTPIPFQINMEIVKNRMGSACFLACLESFLHDNGVELTQEKMVGKFKPDEMLVGQDGVVQIEKEIEVCKRLGVGYEDVEYHFPINSQYDDGSLLITTHAKDEKGTSQLHCLRYYKSVNDKKVLVMDPDFNRDNNRQEYAYWDRDKIEQSECRFHRIEMRQD